MKLESSGRLFKASRGRMGSNGYVMGVRIQSRKRLEHCAVPRGMPLGFVCLVEALKSHAAVAEE